MSDRGRSLAARLLMSCWINRNRRWLFCKSSHERHGLPKRHADEWSELWRHRNRVRYAVLSDIRCTRRLAFRLEVIFHHSTL